MLHTKPRIILGLDPGSRITGFGFIGIHENKPKYLESGCIKTESKNMFERLKIIFANLKELVDHFQPTEAAIEEVFMHHNAQSALKLGQARGAAISAISTRDIPITGYTARQVKQAIVGYGAAEKSQIGHMVKTILSLDKTPQTDAADALAIALCHWQTSANVAKIKAAEKPS